MSEAVDRFVEWAEGADCYVMVEVVYAAPSSRPRRHLSRPMRQWEIKSRLLDAGVPLAEIDRLLLEARERSRSSDAQA